MTEHEALIAKADIQVAHIKDPSMRERLIQDLTAALKSDTAKRVQAETRIAVVMSLMTEFSNYEPGMDPDEFTIRDHMFVDFEFWGRLIDALSDTRQESDDE